MKELEKNDEEIFKLIKEEDKRQEEGLEMIASENFTFKAVLEAAGSILTNKYAEGYPHKRYYGGCEVVDKIEDIAIERAKRLFDCDFANVQAHSGSQANAAVYAALLNKNDKILGMDLSQGGHLTHGSKVNMSGKLYESFFYGVDERGLIDYEKIREIASIVRPKLIIAGASAYPREIDFAKFRQIADEFKAYLFVDMAHIAGLVAAKEHPNPFPHAHVVSSTTHKTLRGPRGGIILSNDEEIAKKINSAIFPGIQGGPLMHIIAAKAVGFKYNLDPKWKKYIKKVKANSKVLATCLKDEGFSLVSGGTDNHLVLLSLLDKDYSGKDAEIALGKAGITVNKNTVPGETRSPFITSGVRLGTPALSARHFEEEQMKIVAKMIAKVLNNIKDTNLQAKIKEEIKEMNKNFKIYKSSC